MKTFIGIFMALFVLISVVHGQEKQQLKFASLAWSPDGNQLLFSAIKVKPDWSDFNRENWRLILYNVKKREFKRITDSALFGTISPNGIHIAYEQNEGENREVFLENMLTHERTNLTNHPAKDGAPMFSPDGKKLVFNSDRNGGNEIFVIDMENHEGAPIQITYHAPDKSYNPEWSPDGQQFVYYLEKGDRMDQIWVSETTGRFPQNITNDTLHSYYPAWTPKGDIIFTSKDNQIYQMKADGSGRKGLGINSHFARVSPKKKKVAYISNDDAGIVIAKYPKLKKVAVINEKSLKGKGYW